MSDNMPGNRNATPILIEIAPLLILNFKPSGLSCLVIATVNWLNGTNTSNTFFKFSEYCLYFPNKHWCVSDGNNGSFNETVFF